MCTGEGFSTEHVFVIRDTFVTARQKKNTNKTANLGRRLARNANRRPKLAVKPFLHLTAAMSSVRYTLKPSLELRLP